MLPTVADSPPQAAGEGALLVQTDILESSSSSSIPEALEAPPLPEPATAHKLKRKKKAQQHLKKKEYFRKKNESREEMIRKGNMKTLEQLIACVEPKYGTQNLCSDKLLIACCNLEKVSCRQL